MRPHFTRWPGRNQQATRIAFLVSTTRPAAAASTDFGANAYSYACVLDAMAPVLERFGTWRLIDQPESALAFAARVATSNGFRPVHLALAPPQSTYHVPGVPTVLFPFWEFPDIPNRNFGLDTRQNWARIARRAAAILTASPFTAEAFQRAGVDVPTVVVPIPAPPESFAMPAWDPNWVWSHDCRHLDLRPQPIPEGDPDRSDPLPCPASAADRGRLYRAAWRAYLWLYPRLNPATTARLVRAQRSLREAARESPSRLAYRVLRGAYRRGLRRGLSDQSIQRIRAIKNRMLVRYGVERAAPPPPLLPETTLRLSGIVFTSILNLRDARKNWTDLLSAFLIAFRDRPDVTLVLKLVTNTDREHADLTCFLGHYHGLRIGHRCRIIVTGQTLDEAAMAGLFRASTFYVNTSHAEGACLPLRQALASGRPAIAPVHSALADVMGDRVGLVIRSFPEPTSWPHDPSQRLETEQHRLVWQDIVETLRLGATIAAEDRPRYDAMAEAGRDLLREQASHDRVAEAIAEALTLLSPEAATTPAHNVAC